MRRIVRIEELHRIDPLVTPAVTSVHILKRNGIGGFRRGVVLRLALPRQYSSSITAIPGISPTLLSERLFFDLSKSPRLVCYFYLHFASDQNFPDVASQVRPEDWEGGHDRREVDLENR